MLPFYHFCYNKGMKNHDLSLNLSQIPQLLHQYLKNQKLRDVSSHSGALVLEVGNKYFLKIDIKGKLQEEAQLTKWFYQHQMAVEVIAYISTDRDYLLTRASLGFAATSFLNSPESICAILGQELRKLHHSKLDKFPDNHLLESYRQRVKKNYQMGLFYEKSLLPMFRISSREEAFQLVEEKGNLLETNACIHGDACLPNVILKDPQTFSCFIDWGLAGYSDKHIDIFWAIWSIKYNLKNDKYIEIFLDNYSKAEINWEILQIVAAHEAFGD